MNTGYICFQSTTNCAGAWSAKFTLRFAAKPGSIWPGGGGCTASGSVLTCILSGSSGTFPSVRVPQYTTCTESVGRTSLAADVPCYNLPPTGELPLLTLRAIKNIRDSHFEGGASLDPTKGIFYSYLTNNDLQKIWETGMTSAGEWKLNKNNYYEKTFAFTGAGIQSPEFGGSAPATKVTLVVAQYGDGKFSEVITMYPATG